MACNLFGTKPLIIWTNGVLLTRPLRTNFKEIIIQNSNIFIKKKTLFENAICKMAPILSWP